METVGDYVETCFLNGRLGGKGKYRAKSGMTRTKTSLQVFCGFPHLSRLELSNVHLEDLLFPLKAATTDTTQGTMPCLTRLGIAHSKLGSLGTLNLARAIAGGLAPGLQFLSLENNNNDGGLVDFLSTLFGSAAQTTKLSHLSWISDNIAPPLPKDLHSIMRRIDEPGRRRLETQLFDLRILGSNVELGLGADLLFPKLERLVLDATAFDFDSQRIVRTFVDTMLQDNLRSLSLQTGVKAANCGEMFGDESVSILFRALADKCPHLRDLSLQNHCIGDAGIAYFVMKYSQWPNLENVHLGDNTYGTAAIVAMVKGIMLPVTVKSSVKKTPEDLRSQTCRIVVGPIVHCCRRCRDKNYGLHKLVDLNTDDLQLRNDLVCCHGAAIDWS